MQPHLALDLVDALAQDKRSLQHSLSLSSSGFCGGSFEPASKGFPVVKTFRRVLRCQQRRCNGAPRQITLNFAISKFVSHRNRIPRQLCLRAFIAASFASNSFRREFRRQNFSPAPIFRRRLFSPAPFFADSSFRRTDPSRCPQKHQLGLAVSFFQKASKAAPSYFHAPCRYW